MEPGSCCGVYGRQAAFRCPRGSSHNGSHSCAACHLVAMLRLSSRPGWTIMFWLNILLTILDFIPGNGHAIWIIARR
jgi:hypothetical protein